MCGPIVSFSYHWVRGKGPPRGKTKERGNQNQMINGEALIELRASSFIARRGRANTFVSVFFTIPCWMPFVKEEMSWPMPLGKMNRWILTYFCGDMVTTESTAIPFTLSSSKTWKCSRLYCSCNTQLLIAASEIPPLPLLTLVVPIFVFISKETLNLGIDNLHGLNLRIPYYKYS